MTPKSLKFTRQQLPDGRWRIEARLDNHAATAEGWSRPNTERLATESLRVLIPDAFSYQGHPPQV